MLRANGTTSMMALGEVSLYYRLTVRSYITVFLLTMQHISILTYSSHTYHHIFAANSNAVTHQCLTGTYLRQNAFYALVVRLWNFLFADWRQHNL
jgi:hypothetical protein